MPRIISLKNPRVLHIWSGAWGLGSGAGVSWRGDEETRKKGLIEGSSRQHLHRQRLIYTGENFHASSISSSFSCSYFLLSALHLLLFIPSPLSFFFFFCSPSSRSRPLLPWVTHCDWQLLGQVPPCAEAQQRAPPISHGTANFVFSGPSWRSGTYIFQQTDYT